MQPTVMLTSAHLALPAALLHPLHYQVGWGLILTGFLTGAGLGLGFHREGFAGGYGSLRRRMLRLGHIACVALGGMLVLVALSPAIASESAGTVSGVAWLVGALLMPITCFLTAWRERFRHLFPLPVLALVTGVVCILVGGTS